jgi:CHAT domain-containing protein
VSWSCSHFTVLHTHIKSQKVSGRARPRISWCATGDFSFLPIHAATGVSQDGVTESASDYFVSSYVPTLSALTKSRAGWRSIQRSRLTGLLAACKNSPGQRTLDNVVPEVEATKECFESVSARVLLSSSPNTSAQVLRDGFKAQSPHILHLACHGEQAKSPLESAFLLSDGRLSIQDLMRIHLPDAVLAFLSACQTASASEDQPDQAVHLAASMLFCGFRSVVGTMW